MRRELTKIILGEENQTDAFRLENQLAKLNDSAIQTARGVGGARAAAADNKRKLIEAEEQILLRAFKTDVQKLEEQTLVEFSELYINLDNINKQIELKASKPLVDNLENVVDQLESTVTIQAGEISTKVSHNEVISSINQTPEEIRIQANKINLSGYVTASQLQAEVADITFNFASLVATNTLEANSALIEYMTYQGDYVEWKSKTVQTSIPEFAKTSITLANGNQISVVTGWQTAPSSLRSTLSYLG